ncbi:MAG TPA: redox-regulated ATPase YchF [Candidatus Humimicrobiaceae bacterium]|nr:redox-regulated ATPase YchF [Candidatus Humimicrobiaceae bacterium]
MSFSVGIVGLPNAGKSTLFKALTKKPVDIGPYPFTTIHPNFGIVQVPDERLEKIAETIKPEKATPTIIEFIDIAGLVKGSHKGEGLGNQFLAQIRNCDAILEVVRAFEDPRVENTTGKIDPASDIETIKIELELKDVEIEERAKAREGKEVAETSSHLPSRLAPRGSTKENLLSKKPVIYLLNINGKTSYQAPKAEHLAVNLKDEVEMFELSEAEKKELGLKSQLDQLILGCYNILDLITFYTITGGKETRAWTLKNGLTAPDAGGVVHTDFKEGFIRAEVANWQELVTANGWKEARERGWIQTVGRDYIVKDGDVIEFKI